MGDDEEPIDASFRSLLLDLLQRIELIALDVTVVALRIEQQDTIPTSSNRPSTKIS